VSLVQRLANLSPRCKARNGTALAPTGLAHVLAPAFTPHRAARPPPNCGGKRSSSTDEPVLQTILPDGPLREGIRVCSSLVVLRDKVEPPTNGSAVWRGRLGADRHYTQQLRLPEASPRRPPPRAGNATTRSFNPAEGYNQRQVTKTQLFVLILATASKPPSTPTATSFPAMVRDSNISHKNPRRPHHLNHVGAHHHRAQLVQPGPRRLVGARSP
jgi:hypothetical protein